MNIFFLHSDPTVAASMYCDQHINKIQLEICQMISTAFHAQNKTPAGIYKSAFLNHPTSVWVRESKGNLYWTLEHLSALRDIWVEAGFYGACASKTIDVFTANISLLRFDVQRMTSVRLAMPAHIKNKYGSVCSMDNAVLAYREYYKEKEFKYPAPKDKPLYTINPTPDWWS